MPVPPWWPAPSTWPRRCAFHDTGLEEALRSRGIDTLIITGIATNFGVEQTARFADEFGFQVIVPEDAVKASVKASSAPAISAPLCRSAPVG
ncbi:isochorismatase family cysteine hydrolase [Nonomuraea sp. NPDC049400]|uniref:isochorismatase family cysteine hydrolase n=1 Tax=Nonomuraea sp. NPDC049400 TaxID=3364352 RepID=UPI00378798C4